MMWRTGLALGQKLDKVNPVTSLLKNVFFPLF